MTPSKRSAKTVTSGPPAARAVPRAAGTDTPGPAPRSRASRGRSAGGPPPADGAAPPRPLRDVPYMGVIFVVAEAAKLGFVNGHPDWCNLGQGQPEVGPLEGAPPRIETVTIRPEDHAYGPLGGIDELRALVAQHYNRLYRAGKRSQYGPQNVAVAQGGRLALSRALAALAPVNVGYQLPDYSAYEDMLDLHLARMTPVPLRASEERGFAITVGQLEQAVDAMGLQSLILSNPCNPTGRVLAGDELAGIVAVARERGCTLLLDEFYSHFIYRRPSGAKPGAPWLPGAGPVSAAAHVEDVEREPVLLFDGLTKCYRYPGWRVGWVVGPADMVDVVGRVASALDGGPSRIAQRAAIEALQPARADQETNALRVAFTKKRNLMVERLSALGVRFAAEPEGTFYAWGSLEALPPPLDDSMTFFRQALQHKVMTVPGHFFDVNPGRRRAGPSPYRKWMRFSFGPPMDNLRLGLDRLTAMVEAAKRR